MKKVLGIPDDMINIIKNPRTFRFADALSETVENQVINPITIQTIDGELIDGAFTAHVIPNDCPALW
eukprot:4312407-Heterocapsa_arctica.AAC.1